MTPIENHTGFPPPAPLSSAKIQFTAEEIKVMKECNREGFVKRGIPFGAVFAYGAFYALKTGLIKQHIKYGMLPGIAVGGLIGCFTGSLSYKAKCVQRVLALPNSTLRQQIEAVLQQQKPVMVDSIEFVPEQTELDPRTQMVSGTQMESYSSTNSFDGFSGEDIDGDQPANFNTSILGRHDSPPQTYDELRRRNREDYIRSTSSRLPQQSVDPRSTLSQRPVFDDDTRFDRDKVPQYQLVD